MRSGFRFHPPRVDFPSEFSWVFRHSFSPSGVEREPGTGVDPAACFECAEKLDLVARIGARVPIRILQADAGNEVASRFQEALVQAATFSMLVDVVAGEVSKIGNNLDLPLIFLKGSALHLGGHIVPGSRRMGDVDLLAPRDRFAELAAGFEEAGFQKSDPPEPGYQLGLFIHRSGINVEVHSEIPGVRVVEGRSATPVDLVSRGLFRTTGEPVPGCLIPIPEVVLSHILVHGIAQHGLSPSGYPMARFLGDVQDLTQGTVKWDAFIDDCFRWIHRDVSLEETKAVGELVQALNGGRDPAEIAERDDHPGKLIRHIVAGKLDSQYEVALRFRGMASHPVDAVGLRGLVDVFRRVVWLNRAQIDVIYGKPNSELGYWGRRLFRPFDLVLRAGRYGWAWVKLKIRRR